MRNTGLPKSLAIAIVVIGILVACDNKSPSPNPNTPSPTPTRSLSSVAISGPDTIAPGQTGQFTLTARYSDGTSDDVSKTATWRAGRASVLTIVSGGLATAHDLGESSVTASFSSRSATKGDVVVAPEGTFRLSGRIRDAPLFVAGAEVRIMSGPSEGLTTLSSFDGTYKMYGAVGDSEVRVRKEGYDDARQHFNVTASISADFNMILSKPRDIVAGTYTLRITAAPECGALPPEARQRTYTAVVTQDGSRLQVVLQDASFYKSGSVSSNTFFGAVQPGGVTFTPYGGALYYGYYYYRPDVLEQLTATSLFMFGGTATVTATPAGRAGALSGVVGILQAPKLTPMIACNSSNHRFELVR